MIGHNRSANRRSARRGFAMVFSLFIVMLLFVIGLAMLAVSQYASGETMNAQTKQNSFNAAEAGIDTAIDKLDSSVGFSTNNGSGSLSNGYTYTYSVTNNLSGANPLPITDPVTGNPVQIPPNRALVVSTGQGPNSERATTVEAVLKNTQITVNFPNDAIDAGLDISGNWNFKIGLAGSTPSANDANIHANHNITATVGFLQGTASASGTIDSLNSGPGGVDTPQRLLPTSQLGPFVTSELAIAQAGGQYALYIPSSGSVPSTFTCPTGAPSNGCTVFFDGPLSISGSQTISFTGKVIFIVNGNYSSTGNSSIQFQPGSRSLFVVNGNADIGGNGTASGLVWVKGDTILHGNGNYFGAIVTGGNAIFNGGGSGGGFKYDASLNNFQLNVPGHVVVSVFGEY